MRYADESEESESPANFVQVAFKLKHQSQITVHDYTVITVTGTAVMRLPGPQAGAVIMI